MAPGANDVKTEPSSRASDWLTRSHIGHLAQSAIRKTADSTPSGTESAHGVARFTLYAAMGVAVGFVVIAIEWVSIELILAQLIDAPLVVQAGAPTVGLVVTAGILRLAWNTSPATSDVYVQAFHGETETETRRVGPKLLAAIATAGSGGAVGLEGPSIYAGSAIGQEVGRGRISFLGERSRRVLLAAGAAAGVAAVFKAPATGVLFALEAPYRRDVARQALIPALVASSAAYVTFVLVLGADRLLLIRPAEVPLLHEVLGAVVVGLVAGVGARAIALLFHQAKDVAENVSLKKRLPLAAVALALTGILGDALVDRPVTLGPSADIVTEVVLDPTISVWIFVALFAVRAVATSATLGAGGVGGVFIPLVVQGLLLGRIVEVLFDAPSTGLFPVVGLAAVLGAGYRTPLAAVMFVAETTGRAEFVIPALLATAVSQSLMGDISVSSGQVDQRVGLLERRLALKAEAVAFERTKFFAPDTKILAVVDQLPDIGPHPVVAVYGDKYEGLLVLSEIASSIMDHGPDTPVRDLTRDIPAIKADAPASEAARIITEHNTAAVVVLDEAGVPAGLITAVSLAGLDQLD